MWPLTSYGCPNAGCALALNLARSWICAVFWPLAQARPPSPGPGDITALPQERPSSRPQKAVSAGEACSVWGRAASPPASGGRGGSRPFWGSLILSAAPGGLCSTAVPGNIPFFVTWLSSHLCRPPAPLNSLFLFKYPAGLWLASLDERGLHSYLHRGRVLPKEEFGDGETEHSCPTLPVLSPDGSG